MPTDLSPARKTTTKDAGDEASGVRFKHGARGAVVCILDDEGQIHIGLSGISPQMAKEIGCGIIHSSYLEEAKLRFRP